jgi:poly(3-hydroxybutyrate) depolymerase
MKLGWTVVALGLAGCTVGSHADERCGGYLGCSAGQTVGTHDPTPTATDVDGVLKGPGCGQPLPADQPTTVPGQPDGYKKFAVTGTGATLAAQPTTPPSTQPKTIGPRTFWVRVPADYDPNHAYRVVYLGGGYGVTTPADFYPLYDEALGGREDAIYVAIATPSDRVNADGYDDRSGSASEEWEAFQMFQTVVDHTYCVDDNHLYAVGYETGATLANMWGCYFAGDGRFPASTPDQPREFAPGYHLRGEGVVSGSDPDNARPCNGPVAFLGIHDAQNQSVPLSRGLAARDRALRMNGCEGSSSTPWHEATPGLESCVRYTACPRDYPVVFCETSGLGQSWQESTAVPAFARLFDDVESVAPAAP